jgi:hypothetical protein
MSLEHVAGMLPIRQQYTIDFIPKYTNNINNIKNNIIINNIIIIMLACM